MLYEVITTRYYSFKTIDLSAMELTTERLEFINQTLASFPEKIRETAIANSYNFV